MTISIINSQVTSTLLIVSLTNCHFFNLSFTHLTPSFVLSLKHGSQLPLTKFYPLVTRYFVRTELPGHVMISPPHYSFTKTSSSIRINFNLSPTPIILSVLYIPPSATVQYFSDIFVHLHYLFSSHKFPIFVVGDFNCPDLNWSTLTATSNKSSSLCDFMFDNNLLQLIIIDFPTHSAGNLLDLTHLIITNYNHITAKA